MMCVEVILCSPFLLHRFIGFPFIILEGIGLMLRLRLRVFGMNNVGLISAQDRKYIVTLGFLLGPRIDHIAWTDRISAPYLGLRIALAVSLKVLYVVVGWREEQRQ